MFLYWLTEWDFYHGSGMTFYSIGLGIFQMCRKGDWIFNLVVMIIKILASIEQSICQ